MQPLYKYVCSICPWRLDMTSKTLSHCPSCETILAAQHYETIRYSIYADPDALYLGSIEVIKLIGETSSYLNLPDRLYIKTDTEAVAYIMED